MKGVKYYIISNTETKSVEVFELVAGKYTPKTDTQFSLTENCRINFDVYTIWQLM